MASDPHAQELADERAAEKQYSEAMHRRARMPIPTEGARNTLWTGTGQVKLPVGGSGRFVGRVALAGPDSEHLDGRSDFYIGDGHYELDGVEVFNWAARVACTFFRGAVHHPLCEQVAVIRTYDHTNGGISEFYDEAIVDDPPGVPFRRRDLRIPVAPTRATLPITVPSPSSKPADTADAARTQPLPPESMKATYGKGPDSPEKDGLRAADLLQARLAAPRRDQLASVLSTLQPDQYEVVAAPGRTNRFIEGQPGTGKTIIAAHRAAFLVSPVIEEQDKPEGKVMLVGPSRQYSRHVAHLLERLAPATPDLIVLSLQELLEKLTGRSENRVWGPPSYSWQDVSQELADFAFKAWRRITSTGRPKYAKLRDAVEHVYETLRVNGGDRPLTTEREWREYLRRLPRFRDAQDDRSLQPLLAYIGGQVQPLRALQGVRHVIVDEAQDVHPLEWAVLTEINVNGHWTILGDLNQRRSDHTEGSWRNVAAALAFEDENLPLVRLQRGYRSTRPIIQFANKLLPKTERELASLQNEGPEPLVVATKTLSPEAIAQAFGLLDRHPHGTVAIIDTAPGRIREELRTRGWVIERADATKWRRDSRALTVIDPDHARGLEFDGVVVVEPWAFPPNLGRRGQLYTALTRPNRELVIVHQKPLPEELRGRRRP